jgi:hypothetical protein
MSCSKKLSSVGLYDSGMNIPPPNNNNNNNGNVAMAGTVSVEPYKPIEKYTYSCCRSSPYVSVDNTWKPQDPFQL